MTKRGRCLLAAVVTSCALVSNAFGQLQTGGVANTQASAVAEPGTREASADEAAQEALAEWIVAREEEQSGRRFDSAFRARALQSLAALSVSALEARKTVEGLGTNDLGDSQADLVYTPVTPCRIIDTRVAGGALSPGVPRSFKVTGDTTFQGGVNCGIPFGPATSAMINFVAVSPAGLGNMQITPFGQALPLASFINYSSTAGTNLANGLAVAMCDPATATCTNDVTIKANVSGVHLVADVQGYFAKPGPTPPSCLIQTASVAVANLAQINYPPGLASPACPAGYTLTGGGNRYSGAITGFSWWNSYPEGSSWVTSGHNATGAGVTVHVYGVCCRVP